jgi:hypothetical protein
VDPGGVIELIVERHGMRTVLGLCEGPFVRAVQRRLPMRIVSLTWPVEISSGSGSPFADLDEDEAGLDGVASSAIPIGSEASWTLERSPFSLSSSPSSS